MIHLTNISTNATSKSKTLLGLLDCMMLCENCCHKTKTCCTNFTTMYGNASMNYWCMDIS